MTRLASLARRAATLAALAASLAPMSRAFAQSISGTVRGDGHAVVGARVEIPDLERVAYTDASGHFTLGDVPRGTYRVFTMARGYESGTDTVAVSTGAASATITLRAAAVALNRVVVTASPVAHTTNELYQSADAKSRADLMQSAGASIAEKMSDLPGVTVRENGSAPTRPIVRGLGDNELLVLENGLRMGDIATYDPAHATPLEAISVDRVEVVRGPATILYGSSTIGGVVNVVTSLVPTVADRPLTGTLAYEGNSVNDGTTGYARALFSGAGQALSISGGGVRASNTRIPAGVYVDPETGAPFALSRMPQTFDHSGEGAIGYVKQGDFGSIGIGGRRYEMNYGIPGVPPNPNFEDVPPTTSRIAQQRSTFELRSLFNVASSFAQQLRLDAAYNDYTHSEYPTAQDSSGVSDPQANHFHKRELNAVLQMRHVPIGRLQGTIGLWTDIQDLSISGDQPLGPNSLTTGIAAYAYEEFAASAATRIQAGVRFDYNKIETRPYAESTDSVFRTLRDSRLSNALTASLGVVQQLAPGLTGSLSVARSFRAPTVQELFANGLDAASGTYSIGTATLGPETGLGVDASLRGDFDAVSFELSPFVNYIHDYIYGFLRGDQIDDFPVRKFSATDARLYGAEAAVTVRPMPHVAIRASADYVNAENTEEGVPLPFIPPLRGLLRTTYQDDARMAMIEWRVAARQSRLGDGDTPTGGYGIVNLGVGYRLPIGAHVNEISLHLDNAFNRVYRDNLSVIKDFLPQPARAVRLDYQLQY